jgi:acyl carrier protein
MLIEQKLLGLIAKFFNEMPPSVRVLTYLVIVFLFAYGTIQPHTVTGRIVVKDPRGREIHYRGQEIMADFGDKPMKHRTNEDGIFVVPAPRVGTLKIRVDLAPLDPNGEEDWRPVTIGPGDYWLKDIVELVYSKKNRKLKIAGNPSEPATTQIVQGLFGRSAHAGMITKKIREGRTGDAPWTKSKDPELAKKVRRRIALIVGEIVGKAPSTIGDNFPFRPRAREISFFDLLVVIDDVEKAFKIKIPDDHWKALRNVGELSAYVVKRINISDHYKIKRSENWRKVQRSIPKQDRPVFKRR